MAAPTINTVAVPDSMKSRGVYLFNRQRTGSINGNGQAQAAGPQIVTWQFKYMTPTELAFWYTTLCGGALSVDITAAELWSDIMVDTAFTGGVLYRPVWGNYAAGAYWDVTVTASHLLPLI